MNTAVISGRLAKNAVTFGKEQETLKFTVACQSGYDSEAKQAKVEFIPCVLFRAPEKLRALLVREGKGKPVEFRGRVITSSYDKNGETRYVTEIVADLREFQLLRLGSTQPQNQAPVTKAEYIEDRKGDSNYASNTRTNHADPGYIPGF